MTAFHRASYQWLEPRVAYQGTMFLWANSASVGTAAVQRLVTPSRLGETRSDVSNNELGQRLQSAQPEAKRVLATVWEHFWGTQSTAELMKGANLIMRAEALMSIHYFTIQWGKLLARSASWSGVVGNRAIHLPVRLDYIQTQNVCMSRTLHNA